jgi:hypothetical protein
MAVKYLFSGSDPATASRLAIAAERVLPDTAALPEIGARTREYDREWEVVRIEHDGEDTLVHWAPVLTNG